MNYADMGFKPLKICDTHVHIISPVKVEESQKTFGEIMDYFGYSRLGIMAVTTECGHNDCDHTDNLKAFYVKDGLNRNGQDRCFVYANPLYHLDGTDSADYYLSEVKELYRMGADGFKFLDGKPNMRKKINRRLDDPIYDKMYAFFEEEGLPVKMHIADPRRFWGPREKMGEYELKSGWWCGDGSCPSFEELHEEVYGILRKFPHLKFCTAHCFFLGDDIDGLTEFMENWENTSFDLTPAAINFVEFSKKPDEWRTFFQKYSKRIFYGTDTYNTTLSGEMEKYERWSAPSLIRRMLEYPTDKTFTLRDDTFVPLGLDDATLSDIYSENHKRMHPHAKALDCELIAFRAKEMLTDVKARRIPCPSEEVYVIEEHNMQSVIKRFSSDELQ